jgi:hypothetical protein
MHGGACAGNGRIEEEGGKWAKEGVALDWRRRKLLDWMDKATKLISASKRFLPLSTKIQNSNDAP